MLGYMQITSFLSIFIPTVYPSTNIFQNTYM